MGDYRNGGDAIGFIEERADDASHVEDLKRAGKDGKRPRLYRLCGTRFDETPSQAAARAFIGQEQADGSGPHDQDVGVQCGIDYVYAP